ncbi:MAG: outer membrane lipoprotein-sorting protein [candidate division Zixibacteria bacterium]|nr:outer membrane lipoprotein-sorting protein [candidate division Zixibacteria bacterium]
MICRTIIITSIVIFVSTVASIAQSLTADEIIDKVIEIMNQQYVKATMTMTIMTSSGKQRTFVYETFSKDKGEKNLIKYISPGRVKDQATLMLNHADDIWAYFPRTNRVRKLATHAKKQKMEGSDFSYEDMGSGDAWSTDFEVRLLADDKIEGVACYVLNLVKKPDTESGYSRQVIWVRQDNFFPIQIDYYDEDDPDYKLKRLSLLDIREIEDVPTAMKLVMHNLQDNSETIMEYQDVTYAEELPDDIFTERGMKK